MYPDRKVYDSDIAITPVLREIANEYARTYVGNFDMMIQARQLVAANGTLPDGVIRPVLNTLRSDPLRIDLWEAVKALVRPIPQSQVAEVISFQEEKEERKARRRREREEAEQEMRETHIVYRHPPQAKVKAIFATTIHKSSHSVLHWLQPEGHEVDWGLNWLRSGNYREMCARGTGLQREFRLKAVTFCQGYPQSRYRVWLHRPTVGEAWGGKYAGDTTPLPDCRSCLRVIGLAYMDSYPPDRNPVTGEYEYS